MLSENAVQGTIGEDGRRVWLYPREIKGRFTRRRGLVAWALLAAYLIGPWLRWDHAPFLRLDPWNHRADLGPWHFWSQDLRLFLPALFAGIVLFLAVTAILGRVWCGWLCPQTVFLQFVFGPIERWVEGRASVRKQRDAAGWSAAWAARKLAKHALFLVVSALISNTALAYVWGAPATLAAMGRNPAGDWTAFAGMAAFALAFYGVFAWFKEQACILICPYARFQSALTDTETMVVAYDAKRGEPRGRARKDQRAGLGDCVNCNLCVQVCPTGIDIRQGSQLECIGCARCMDACDSVMAAWKKPSGLIRYATLKELDGKGKARLWRPRTMAYLALAGALAGFFALLVAGRSSIDADLVRSGSSPYGLAPGDSVANTFLLRVRNRDSRRHVFTLDFAVPAGARNTWQGRSFALGAGQQVTLPVTVWTERAGFHGGRREARLRVSSGAESRDLNTTLIGPYGG